MNPRIVFLFGLLIALQIPGFAEVKTGEEAPDFTLKSIEGKDVSLSDYKGKIVVLEWFNSECPFVKKHYKNGDMQALQSKYAAKGVVWLTINSTNPEHANFFTDEQTKDLVKKQKIRSTTMLPDPDGDVGKDYGAKSTPHMFIVDAKGNVVYQGAIDDRPAADSNPKKATNYVRKALDELLAGKPVSTAETKQYGCGVKYKS